MIIKTISAPIGAGIRKFVANEIPVQKVTIITWPREMTEQWLRVLPDAHVVIASSPKQLTGADFGELAVIDLPFRLLERLLSTFQASPSPMWALNCDLPTKAC